MRAYSPVSVILWLSIMGALLVMGAAREQEDSDNSSDETRFDDNDHGDAESDSLGSGLTGSPNKQTGRKNEENHLIGHRPHQQLGSLGDLVANNNNKGSPLGLLGQMTDGITGLMGGNKGSPLIKGDGPIAQAAKAVISPLSGLKGDGEASNSSYVEPIDSITDLGQLILKPAELVKQISQRYNLPLTKLVDKLGSELVVGLEALLQPLMACVKIIEKVFQPDACCLKFMCEMGSRLHFAKQHLLKFSHKFIENSVHLKALNEGIGGKQCESTYQQCGKLRLNKPFEELKDLKESKVDVGKETITEKSGK